MWKNQYKSPAKRGWWACSTIDRTFGLFERSDTDSSLSQCNIIEANLKLADETAVTVLILIIHTHTSPIYCDKYRSYHVFSTCDNTLILNFTEATGTLQSLLNCVTLVVYCFKTNTFNLIRGAGHLPSFLPSRKWTSYTVYKWRISTSMPNAYLDHITIIVVWTKISLTLNCQTAVSELSAYLAGIVTFHTDVHVGHVDQLHLAAG